MPRSLAIASSSLFAKWSATPLIRVWSFAPPSSSADAISPIAAFTSGGPPKKIVPVLFTIIASSLIAGTYAPPAVQEPITTANWGIPFALILAWL